MSYSRGAVQRTLISGLTAVAAACSRREIELELLFGSNFRSRLERCVTNTPFVA